MRILFLIACIFITTFSKAQTDSLSSKFPIHSNYFSSFDGTKIYYEVRGKGKPVFLVHGFIVDGNSWKHATLYSALLEKNYKVITLDMRGNGKSGKPHDSTAYDNDAEAKDIILLMNSLKIKHYSVVGYSRGSIITARLLVLDKRIKDAVLGGMGADFTNPVWPRRIMFYHALRGDSVPELKGLVEYVQQKKLDQLALAYLQRSQPSTSKEELSKVTQPVLVISGSEDSDNGSSGELAGLLPKSTIATVPGDHNHASATKEFADAVIHFLEKNTY
ncbi:alpha/beta hydrolase [Ginsengibacter hankyongi]|uniref:Alpha/beta hydrolase n=1 Tax=Ginsengibacter hankyongi TaxID=2607284 RepID=A0A5J5IEW3_9BACT|nr:alpha/beta hydrolase [Ginsengibacter hankyongi]KAA9038153.1 alpha/beta hydrolase [Ginsengibacter hankyongi]